MRAGPAAYRATSMVDLDRRPRSDPNPRCGPIRLPRSGSCWSASAATGCASRRRSSKGLRWGRLSAHTRTVTHRTRALTQFYTHPHHDSPHLFTPRTTRNNRDPGDRRPSRNERVIDATNSLRRAARRAVRLRQGRTAPAISKWPRNSWGVGCERYILRLRV